LPESIPDYKKGRPVAKGRPIFFGETMRHFILGSRDFPGDIIAEVAGDKFVVRQPRFDDVPLGNDASQFAVGENREVSEASFGHHSPHIVQVVVEEADDKFFGHGFGKFSFLAVASFHRDFSNEIPFGEDSYRAFIEIGNDDSADFVDRHFSHGVGNGAIVGQSDHSIAFMGDNISDFQAEFSFRGK